MTVPTPLQLDVKSLQNSPGARKSAAPRRDAFSSLLQNNAQRWANGIARPVSDTSPPTSTGSAGSAPAPSVKNLPPRQLDPTPATKSSSVPKTEPGQVRVEVQPLDRKPKSQSAADARSATAVVTPSPSRSLPSSRHADPVAVRSEFQAPATFKPAAESPALPAASISSKVEGLRVGQRNELPVQARATTSAAAEPRVLRGANPQPAIEMPVRASADASSSPSPVTFKNAQVSQQPAARVLRDALSPSEVRTTQANRTPAHSALSPSQTPRAVVNPQPAAPAAVPARASSSSSPFPATAEDTPAARRPVSRVLRKAASPSDVPPQTNQAAARSSASPVPIRKSADAPSAGANSSPWLRQDPVVPARSTRAHAAPMSSVPAERPVLPEEVLRHAVAKDQPAVRRQVSAALPSAESRPRKEGTQERAAVRADEPRTSQAIRHETLSSQKMGSVARAEDADSAVSRKVVSLTSAASSKVIPLGVGGVRDQLSKESVADRPYKHANLFVNGTSAASSKVIPLGVGRVYDQLSKESVADRPYKHANLFGNGTSVPTPTVPGGGQAGRGSVELNPSEKQGADLAGNGSGKIADVRPQPLQNPGGALPAYRSTSPVSAPSSQKPNPESVPSHAFAAQADAPRAARNAAPETELRRATNSPAVEPKSAQSGEVRPGKTPVATTTISPQPDAARLSAPAMGRETARGAEPPRSFWGMKVVAQPAQSGPMRTADTETLAPKPESKPAATQVTVAQTRAAPSDNKPAPRSAVEKEFPRVNARGQVLSPPVALAAKPEQTDKTVPRSLPGQDSAPAMRPRGMIETSRASVTLPRTTRRDSAPGASRDMRTEPRVSYETSLTPKQAVFDAAPRETKTVAPPLGASAEQQATRVAGETQVLSSFDGPRERPNEPPSAAQTTRMASPSPEKQLRSDLPANPSVRAADAPKATDGPELNRETPSSLRLQPSVLPSDSPLRAVSSATSGRPAAELAVNGSSSRPTPPSDESTHAAAPSQETASEHPSATAQSHATNREALARVEAAVPTPRTRLTVEQIRELQAMVARALQSAQTQADGTARATFNWTSEGFGPLRFSIITRDDGVRIEISSNRREVVKALEEGRANMERVMADLGLRVERFEVRLRAPEFSDSLPQPRPDGGYPERNSNAEPGSSDAVSIDRTVESSGEEAEPARRLSLAEHEWVA